MNDLEVCADTKGLSYDPQFSACFCAIVITTSFSCQGNKRRLLEHTEDNGIKARTTEDSHVEVIEWLNEAKMAVVKQTSTYVIFTSRKSEINGRNKKQASNALRIAQNRIHITYKYTRTNERTHNGETGKQDNEKALF